MLDIYTKIRAKLGDFNDIGRCQISNIEDARIFLDVLHLKNITYTMTYSFCSLGESWLFEKSKEVN